MVQNDNKNESKAEVKMHADCVNMKSVEDTPRSCDLEIGISAKEQGLRTNEVLATSPPLEFILIISILHSSLL